jgi:hypothetical protein
MMWAVVAARGRSGKRHRSQSPLELSMARKRQRRESSDSGDESDESITAPAYAAASAPSAASASQPIWRCPHATCEQNPRRRPITTAKGKAAHIKKHRDNGEEVSADADDFTDAPDAPAPESGRNAIEWVCDHPGCTHTKTITSRGGKTKHIARHKQDPWFCQASVVDPPSIAAEADIDMSALYFE